MWCGAVTFIAPHIPFLDLHHHKPCCVQKHGHS
uniref:Uncharacterized protein n=1 Tax=Physcomitrium patens TaxID=3218 RepID=A0A2K1KT43_PHYPA|nr:hypothetical protein PHYPA_003924 [Physcomitrium patens]